VEELSNRVLVTQLASKGSDASGEHDEEPPPEVLKIDKFMLTLAGN
jgi:hypothetical protein